MESLPECAESFIIVDICRTEGSYHSCSGVSTWLSKFKKLSRKDVNYVIKQVKAHLSDIIFVDLNKIDQY